MKNVSLQIPYLWESTSSCYSKFILQGDDIKSRFKQHSNKWRTKLSRWQIDDKSALSCYPWTPRHSIQIKLYDAKQKRSNVAKARNKFLHFLAKNNLWRFLCEAFFFMKRFLFHCPRLTFWCFLIWIFFSSVFFICCWLRWKSLKEFLMLARMYEKAARRIFCFAKVATNCFQFDFRSRVNSFILMCDNIELPS